MIKYLVLFLLLIPVVSAQTIKTNISITSPADDTTVKISLEDGSVYSFDCSKEINEYHILEKKIINECDLTELKSLLIETSTALNKTDMEQRYNVCQEGFDKLSSTFNECQDKLKKFEENDCVPESDLTECESSLSECQKERIEWYWYAIIFIPLSLGIGRYLWRGKPDASLKSGRGRGYI